MQYPYLLELSESLDPSYREVIDGIASRVLGIRCVLVGELAAPSLCREDPLEVDIIVETPADRDKLMFQLRGIFRQHSDGSLTFVDGGVEIDLRLRIYTPKDLNIENALFMKWHGSASSMDHLPFTFRIASRDDLLAFFTLREVAEDDELILRLLRAGVVLPDTYDLPSSAIARIAVVYADMFNAIADDLEALGEDS